MEAIVRAQLSRMKIPGGHDRVFKSECAYSFDTAESPGGLFTNLLTLTSVGADYLALDRKRTGGVVYLHTKAHRVARLKEPAATTGSADGGAPVKFGIGVAGGFNVDAPSFDVVSDHSIVVFHGPPEDVTALTKLAHPSQTVNLPSLVTAVADAILAIRDTGVAESAAATWEDVPQVSKYADGLIQEASGLRISPTPSEWKCADCDKCDNLWLNLGDGHIGCGRKNWDGSGGNGHALSHFQASNGLYPLCVKLGTISASGGDVYSYAPDEDDMVTDPHLARHLAHWGINVMSLAKTDKSMAELNIDLNASYDFSRICEAGKDLVAVSGPGLIGCENLGNSCYMASVLQAVAALPMTSSLFVGPGGAVARSLYASSGAVPADDLLVQMAKVMAGLTSDKYASPLTSAPQVVMAQAPPAVTEEEATAASNAVALSMTGTSSADAANLTHTTADDAAAVAAGGKGGAAPEVPPGPGSACGFIVPRAFKTLIGKGHPEFSSGRQQDAIQFFEYLLAQLDKVHHKDGKRVNDALTAAAGAGGAAAGSVTNLSQLFSYNVETRLQDLTSSDGNTYVRYTSSQERFWRLPIPMEAAVPIAADTSVTSGGGDVDMSGGSANKRARGETGSPIPTTGAASCSSSSAVPVAPGGAPTQRVPFSACVQSWAAPAHITDWQSPVTGIRGTAAATSRFASFPSVLVIQLGRYTTAPDWTTVKIDASVPMPLSLTLDAEGGVASTAADVSSAGDVTAASSIPSFSIDLRAKGRQAGEAEFPSAAAPAAGSSAAPAAAAAPPQPDPVLVAELESMGFSSGAASRSALATAGAGLEAAMEYLLAHMEDEGFNDPYVPQAAAAAAAPATAAASSAASSVDPAAVSMLCDMGFDPERASYALSTTSGNLERAADWLFAHADEPLPSASAASSGGSGAAMEVEAPSSAAGAAAAAVTGRGVYELTGVISHMGRSTGSGHYVAHLRKGGNGTWYLFNDAKVAVSQDPPLDVGYLYVYTRKE